MQILRAHTDGCRSRPWLACWPASGPLYSRCFQTLTIISVHFPNRWSRGDVSVYWLWLLLYISVVSVVFVIIAICDMPRQEFSLCERVYIHNMYMKNRKLCSQTRRKFQVKFPGRPVPNPSTIRRQAKRFEETGSVKNRKVNRRRHVLTLDEIGERLEHTPKNL